LPPEQRSFDLEDLQLLAALQEAKSLAGAARRLRINHASAWRRLGTLEAKLGVRLFERMRTGYAPTPAGEVAVAMAERVIQEIGEASRCLTGQDLRPSGIVRLTTTEALLGFIAPVLKELRGSHPALVVEVVTANSFFTLTRRDADVALRPAEAVPEGLVARRLATIASAIYASPEYMGDKGDADPLALDWLSPDDSLSHLRSARWISRHIDPVRIVHRANSLTSLCEAARAGVGLAPLPCFLGDADASLIRVTPPITEMASSLWLLTHPDLRRMPRVRAVLDAIADFLSKVRPKIEAGAMMGTCRSTVAALPGGHCCAPDSE
jgi:DNA-binding transcriptional LysR family regulator